MSMSGPAAANEYLSRLLAASLPTSAQPRQYLAQSDVQCMFVRRCGHILSADSVQHENVIRRRGSLVGYWRIISRHSGRGDNHICCAQSELCWSKERVVVSCSDEESALCPDATASIFQDSGANAAGPRWRFSLIDPCRVSRLPRHRGSIIPPRN